jgi:uncharacterized membrane protein YraQ (UPF0718 family)
VDCLINKLKEKIDFKWIFLFTAFLLYLTVFLFNYSLFSNALIKSIEIFISVFPSLILVFLLIFVFNYIIDLKKTVSFLESRKGFFGTIIAVIAGIISTGPIYLWYPLLSELRDAGLDYSFIAVFLYNRAIKLPLLPLFISYFGLPFTIILTFYMIVFSVLNGFFVQKILEVWK